jgi:heat-inducible transcriptional repressor
MLANSLSEREKSVLRYVIHQFILTANPVGSRNIAKYYDLNISPATVRNIMADLEDTGFLNHPHTSAGRIPTDKGYRFYVDSLMERPRLKSDDKKIIRSGLDNVSEEVDDVLRITSVILSNITNQLACVTYPSFSEAILEKIQIIQISSKRILVVIGVKSGMIKTITLEMDSELNAEKLYFIQQYLNEKLAGLTFTEIKKTFPERVQDIDEVHRPIIRVFLDSIDKLFANVADSERTIITGAKNILKQPEFENHEHLQGIIELIEDKDIIVHLMAKQNVQGNEVIIAIGKENIDEKLTDYSTISKKYTVGGVSGNVGIIGPKRMEYSKSIAAVLYIAELLSKVLSNK